MIRQLRLALRAGIVTEAVAPDENLEVLGGRLGEAVRRLFGRSLHIRQVDAGSCNGCELEISGLTGPHYDLERFGLHFVASPPAAGGQDVRIGGGPTVVRDFVAAGLVDHLHLVQVPIVLGRGVRVWDGLEALEDVYDIEATSSPSGVTHLTFTRKAAA